MSLRGRPFVACFIALFVSLCALAAWWVLSRGKEASPARNLVLISMDTTRYDYVDGGDLAKAWTPNLRALAQTSVVFDHAYATTPLTLPSHLSVLTAHPPPELGVTGNDQRYDLRLPMLQQVLAERGFRTAAAVSLGSLLGTTGISTGFEIYRDELFPDGLFSVSGDRIPQEAIHLLDAIRDEPFFLFVHYSDPHTPYAPPQIEGTFTILLDNAPLASFNAYEGRILRLKQALPAGTHQLKMRVEASANDFSHFALRRLRFGQNCEADLTPLSFDPEAYGGAHLMREYEISIPIRCSQESDFELFQVIPILRKQAATRCYRLEVEAMDGAIGTFLQALTQRGLMEHTAIAVFADHGEGHGERDGFFGHSRYLNTQFIHVPLFVRAPHQRHRHVQTCVSLTQLAPTLLDCLGLTVPEFDPTQSLFRIPKDAAESAPPVISWAFRSESRQDRISIITWPYQCIANFDDSGNASREFYLLSRFSSFSPKDGIPESVILEAAPQFFDQVETWLPPLRQAMNDALGSSLAPENLEALRSLGYLQ